MSPIKAPSSRLSHRLCAAMNYRAKEGGGGIGGFEAVDLRFLTKTRPPKMNATSVMKINKARRLNFIRIHGGSRYFRNSSVCSLWSSRSSRSICLDSSSIACPHLLTAYTTRPRITATSVVAMSRVRRLKRKRSQGNAAVTTRSEKINQ